MAGDTNYPLTGLLLPFTGANNSTAFIDTSISPKTITASGNAKIVTSTNDPFSASNGVGYFDGSGDYLSSTFVSAWDLVGTAFTIEGFFKATSIKSTGTRLLATGGGTVGWGATAHIHCLFQFTSSQLQVYISNGTASPVGVVVSTTINTGTWYFVSCCVEGNTLYVGVNGVVTSGSISGYSRPSTNPALNIGSIPGEAGNSVNAFAGYLSQWRIINGVALRKSNFTPPSAPHLTYAGQLAGNITESSPITDWRVSAYQSNTGGLVNTGIFTGGNYSLNTPTLAAHNIMLSPKVDYAWSAGKAIALNDLVVASAPDATPHLWKCTTNGTSHSAEPSWNLSGTTTDNTVTWTYVAPLVDPIAIGPKIPS
jgi:hypothetical protein